MEQVNEFPFNLFDMGVILIVIGSALFAYARGFVHETCAIAGWIGAILATVYGFHFVQPYARQIIKMNILADLSAGTLIFLFTLVVLSTITRNISSRIRYSALNSLDRALGFLFGLVRGALIIVVTYIGFDYLVAENNRPEWIGKARVTHFLKPAANVLISKLPDTYALKRHQNRNNSSKIKQKKDPSDIVREIITLPPKPSNQQIREGYGILERQDMERLIRNNQPK